MNDLSPYLIVVVAGFLPNEVFRVAAVLLPGGVDESSAFLTWVRYVALGLLAAVVSKLVYAPAGALATVPIPATAAAIAVGVAVFFLLRRALVLGILAGEALLVTAAWLAS